MVNFRQLMPAFAVAIALFSPIGLQAQEPEFDLKPNEKDPRCRTSRMERRWRASYASAATCSIGARTAFPRRMRRAFGRSRGGPIRHRNTDHQLAAGSMTVANPVIGRLSIYAA